MSSISTGASHYVRSWCFRTNNPHQVKSQQLAPVYMPWQATPPQYAAVKLTRAVLCLGCMCRSYGYASSHYGAASSGSVGEDSDVDDDELARRLQSEEDQQGLQYHMQGLAGLGEESHTHNDTVVRQHAFALPKAGSCVHPCKGSPTCKDCNARCLLSGAQRSLQPAQKTVVGPGPTICAVSAELHITQCMSHYLAPILLLQCNTAEFCRRCKRRLCPATRHMLLHLLQPLQVSPRLPLQCLSTCRLSV